ncbi:MAG: RNA polymerase sigma-70 factor, ECF subfamily [Bacteroidetes bacterium]|nr:MAG: RNA polymerase sigma-70 factor, ECF subfamily [Bacteroidota bacterium]
MFFRKKKVTGVNDLELVELYQKSHDKYYVGELYQRYSHLVFGLCLGYFNDRETARDAVLQLFEKLFEQLKKHKPDNFKIWLTFVARNHCISEIRKQKTRSGRQDEYLKDEQAVSEEEADAWENPVELREAGLQKLETAVQQLGEEQRMCIDLFYFKEKSYKEICDLTGFSDKQVKSYLQNGKRNLKIMLTGNHEHQHTH